jgi:putative ABC transport system permease protein
VIIVRAKAGNVSAVLRNVKKAWARLNPVGPFE